jgi:hypothetical protein
MSVIDLNAIFHLLKYFCCPTMLEAMVGYITDPWFVLYTRRGVRWTHHPFTLRIFIITYFTCVLIIIFIIP